MSILIAAKDNNRIVVGVDTRMSQETSYVDSYKQRPKAYHLNEKKNVIVGGVGNVGLVDVLKVVMEAHLKYANQIDRHYIVKNIIPELIYTIRVYHMEDECSKMDGTLFIAIDNRAYTIAGNYTVDDIVDFTAIGSGAEVARGSMETSKRYVRSVEDRIALAIEISGSSIQTVSPNAIIGDTAGKIFKLYTYSK